MSKTEDGKLSAQQHLPDDPFAVKLQGRLDLPGTIAVGD